MKLSKKLIICGLLLLIGVLLYYSIYKEGLQNGNHEKIERVCFVIPIHPKHYHFIDPFLEKLDQRIDVFLIFSSEQDYNQLAEKSKQRIQPIIMPDNAPTGNIVTYKKWYALKHVLMQQTKYDYFIVCDAEIDIVEENLTVDNVMQKVSNIFTNKMIYGSICPNDDKVTEIVKISASMFDTNSIERLKKVTEDYTVYYWWSELPVYKRDTLADFFEKIGNIEDLNWYHFDHLVYLNYLILYHGFQLLNMSPLTGIQEPLETFDATLDQLAILKEHLFGFGWMVKQVFHKHRDYLLDQGTFLLYHLDR